MRKTYLIQLCHYACEVHDRATEAYEWFRHNAGYFDEMSSKEQAQVEMKALAAMVNFRDALTIIDKAMHNIREEENNGRTNADT